MPEGRKTDPEDTSLPSRAAGGVRSTLTVSTPRNSAPGEKEEAGVPRECVRDRWWGVWAQRIHVCKNDGFLEVEGWPQAGCPQTRSAGVSGRGKRREEMKWP